MNSVFETFEAWIRPFRQGTGVESSSGLAFLGHFVLQARWPFFAMLLVGGATAGIEALIFTFIGSIVDMMQDGEQAEFFSTYGTSLLLMAFTVLVLRSLAAILTALVEEQTIVPGFFNLVRWQSHQMVMDQSLSYFQDELSGRISQKVWQAGQAAGDFMISALQVVWYIVIYAITTLLLIGNLDWRLGVLVLIWFCGFGLIARHFIPKVRSQAKEVAHAGSGVTGRLVDTYTNIQTVKLFGSREEENRGVTVAYDRFLGHLQSFTRILTSVRALMALLSGTMIVIIGAGALYLWQESLISAGDVAFSLALILRLNILLNRLLGQLNGLFRNFGVLQDSAETIVKPVAVQDRPGAGDLEVKSGRINFDHISFHYGKSGGIIDRLDLSIEPGERVGVVGPSGAGKTTLASLLLRFYDPEAGRILIDGVDISDITQQSLRRSIGMVTQDTSLLHRSIGENIRYGRPSASDDEVRQAAERAHALDFIEAIGDPQGRRGFEARVGERGVKLSGGQRQRIAIARVLLKNAPILVLDEATSALDSEIEAAIQSNLQQLMTGKTVIAIAHRLSTIAALDRLVVMDGGKIVQEGSHDELLRDTSGLYAQLWHRQSGGFLAGERVGTEMEQAAPGT